MNPFVADPEWGWWIIFYFFLGGISAGAYFLATLIELMGQEADRPLARLGYRIAFPLISVCGILLIVDLARPERFWHMIFQSEKVHSALEEGWPLGGWDSMVQAPMLKWFSPMSIGAAALGLFGAWSFLSLVASFWESGRLARLLDRNFAGHLFRLVGSGLGFFVASYTGVLLNATNQPLWSVSEWIAPLFLASAASTAIAVLLLLGRRISPETREHLERADLWALGLELFLFLIFLASLGSLLPFVLRAWQGWILVFGTLILGLLVPLALHLGQRTTAAAISALLGGFVLRFGIVTIAPALLAILANHAREQARLLYELDPVRSYSDPLNMPLYQSWTGVAFIAFALVLSCTIPLVLRRQWGLSAGRTAMACIVSSLVITCVLYYSTLPPYAQPAWHEVHRLRISPEDDREPGGGRGASFFNYPSVFRMKSKTTQND
jgi:protein NrfD